MPHKHVPRRSSRPSPSYEKLFSRVRRIVTTPRALLEKQVDIAPCEGEAPEDWQRLIDHLHEYETVSLIRQLDGSIRLRWRAQHQ
ncbi:DUF1654 domain-containing protein [Aquipseudomonas alcaligenes]|uniref:DUF1654 domain-containing protein n=1 Tax=Aquipseudomonas alcaligenes (strain ATCC 14909 / DSM 50342 / CCUG 1425 / JCM 20561 / NBRC 14159 / NCIMB 9945 / NCTC 10367 / 1577) TaxID=1215092 RepID=U2ZKN1_AQUA1|nr:DUF1654 domain-containing protein [Pseudomonas alcaligenes]GAD62050.1 hypothetical protein PA6_009_00560 [Pseudomonas alcaligenes NBRC 14159]SUD16464.1 Protein of uncharacterised function (DUF1654) [Pseudomonas alcaligenes]